jgi:hypothetical protein
MKDSIQYFIYSVNSSSNTWTAHWLYLIKTEKQ